MASHTHLQCTVVQQQDLQIPQQIFQTMSLDLMTCGLWSQSFQTCVQLGLPLQITLHAVKPMQVILNSMLHCSLTEFLYTLSPVDTSRGVV